MARRKKGEQQSPPAQTAEQLNDEQVQALTYQHMNLYTQALAKKKDADAGLKNVCKIIKAELGPGGLDDIKDLIALDSEEGEAKIKAEVERKLRVARWAGAAFGTQFSMFDDVDRTPAVDRARAEGKRDGMKGAPKKCDYAPSTPQYAAYMEGYDDGQSVTQEAFKDQLERNNSAAKEGGGRRFAEIMREQNDQANCEMAETVRQIGDHAPTHKVVN